MAPVSDTIDMNQARGGQPGSGSNDKPSSPMVTLIVLSGPNKGASMKLRDGEYRIGKSIDCDLVMNDEHVQDVQFILRIRKNTIQIDRVSGDLLVNNFAAKRSRLRIEPGWKLTFGKTVLCFSVQKGDCDVRVSDSNQGGIKDKNNPWLDFRPPHHGAAAQTAKKKKPNVLNPATYILLVMIGAGFMLQYWGVHSTPSHARSNIQGVERLLTDLNLSETLNVTNRDGNALVITGYVKNNDERKQLLAALRDIDDTIQTRLWTNEDLSFATENVLSALGTDTVSVSGGKPGELVVSGYIPQQEEWDKLKEILKNDMPRIKGIDDQNLQTLKSRKEKLDNMLQQAGISEPVNVVIKEGRLIIRGDLNESESLKLQLVLTAFRDQYANLPEAVNQTNSALNDMIRLPIKSVSVFGNVHKVTLVDGSSYTEGSVLPNGMVVETITIDKISLRQNGESFDYRLGME